MQLASASLNHGEYDLWLHYVPEVIDDLQLERYRAALCDDELQRMQRRKFVRHRQEFCTSHAFCRGVLSLYANTTPSDLGFQQGAHGKPYLANAGLESLQFSLSHTRGLFAVLVSSSGEVGADVERCRDRVRGRRVAERYFSPEEVDELFSFPEAEQHRRFFDYWTLKESFIKAKGMGLAIPLPSFSFAIADPEQVQFSACPSIEPDSSRWCFQRVEVGEKHAAAVCLPAEAKLLRIFTAEPLQGFSESRQIGRVAY